mmetsp:Transcript_33310/g.80577  ORF Transcript_33310/g.80577 Transcript_33310/m.80577 type:complete len:87 (-) Transcript_33310:695-955(-)
MSRLDCWNDRIHSPDMPFLEILVLQTDVTYIKTTRVQSISAAGGEEFNQTIAEFGVRDGTNTDSLKRTEEKIGDEFGSCGGTNVQI